MSNNVFGEEYTMRANVDDDKKIEMNKILEKGIGYIK